MGKRTSVNWADHSFNPWRGCSPVSDGCINCTAEHTAQKAPDMLGRWGDDGTRVLTAESGWGQPIKWNADAGKNGVPARVVCMTMGDLFEPWPEPLIDDKGNAHVVTTSGNWVTRRDATLARSEGEPVMTAHAIERLLAMVNRTPNLQWLILTKHPARIKETLRVVAYLGRNEPNMVGSLVADRWVEGTPPPNVWLGTSVEDQFTLSQRLYYLGEVPARLRFVVASPLLGPLDLAPWFNKVRLSTDPFDWMVVGGEMDAIQSARPCQVEWVESVVAQCKAHGTPVWVDRLGSSPQKRAGRTGLPVNMCLTDPCGESCDEWPESVRVREIPDAEHKTVPA